MDRLSDIPRFGDKPGEFPVWFELFKEYGEVRGFGSALKDKPEGDLPDNPSGTITNDQRAAVERNNRAKSALKMALPKKLVISITAAGTADANYPNGKVCLMVAKLFRKYRVGKAMGRINLTQELSTVTMKKWENPEVLFERIEEIIFKYERMDVKGPGAPCEKYCLWLPYR